ncbi:MAG: hypothetical protein D6741_01685 [Planctomycetota bacterium]|nr:MAG: hypothetical protein D6741_01685 [Planctomycetota bacterium]
MLAIVISAVMFLILGTRLWMGAVLTCLAGGLGIWMALAPPAESDIPRGAIAVVIVAMAVILRRLDGPDILVHADPFRPEGSSSSQPNSDDTDAPFDEQSSGGA